MAKGEKGPGKPSERKGGAKGSKAEAAPAVGDAEAAKSEPRVPPRLKEMYRKDVVPALMKEFGYRNPMQVPKLDRIVLNVGMGEAIQNVKLLEGAAAELGVIAGQRPVITKAKKRSPDSNCAKECPLERKSRSEAITCTSFWTGW